MSEVLTNKDNLFKYGFCIFRNLLDKNEIEKYRYTIKKIYEKSGSVTVTDLYNYKETWGYILNDRLLNNLRNLLGPNIYYLHSSSISHFSDVSPLVSWHRDSPCRQVGKGPDWDPNEPYNVVTVITYLSSNEETKSGVNLIPFRY